LSWVPNFIQNGAQFLGHFGSYGLLWVVMGHYGSFWFILAHCRSFWLIPC